jgi:hypothetical protein
MLQRSCSMRSIARVRAILLGKRLNYAQAFRVEIDQDYLRPVEIRALFDQRSDCAWSAYAPSTNVRELDTCPGRLSTNNRLGTLRSALGEPLLLDSAHRHNMCDTDQKRFARMDRRSGRVARGSEYDVGARVFFVSSCQSPGQYEGAR